VDNETKVASKCENTYNCLKSIEWYNVQSIYVGLLVRQNVLYLNNVQHRWPIDMTLSFHEFCKSLKRLIFLSV